ncbi:hypothetical protein FQA39_LY05533 [Lamprigera yunnana]|nr:hypothetical protein FQA39_LY05533 [Lamprigera yunnana]
MLTNTVILTEDISNAFLREHHLLLSGDEVEQCTQCGSEMVEKNDETEKENFTKFGDRHPDGLRIVGKVMPVMIWIGPEPGGVSSQSENSIAGEVGGGWGK